MKKIWPSITELPEYKADFPVYPMQKVPSIVPGLDEDGYDLLDKMIVYDPSQRITAQKAMTHQYFQGAQNLLPSTSTTTTSNISSSSKEVKSSKS